MTCEATVAVVGLVVVASKLAVGWVVVVVMIVEAGPTK